MDIKSNPGFFRNYVEVQIDNEYEWQAVMDGLPKPSYLNMKDLPFVQRVTLQMIEGLSAEAGFPMNINMSERQLRKIGNQLTHATRPNMTREQMLGRLTVTTEIVHFFGR